MVPTRKSRIIAEVLSPVPGYDYSGLNYKKILNTYDK